MADKALWAKVRVAWTARLERLSLLCAFLCLTAAPSLADTVTFTDSTFNLANYTQISVYASNPSLTGAFSQCSSCGNPGQALQVSESLPVGGTWASGVINNGFSYDPATQGTITSISASVDKNLTISTASCSGSLSNTFRPTIEQDGVFYVAAIAGPSIPCPSGTTGFNTISQAGLTAANFDSYDFTTGLLGSAHPDFSGDPMLFGISQISVFGASSTNTTTDAVYDNLSIQLSTVPEPPAILLLCAGLVGLVGLRTRLAGGAGLR